MTIITCDFEKIDNSVKGLADLLWAMAAQIEAGSALRLEGAIMLAQIANNIENMLDSISKENDIAIKDGDVA